jgi:hypothetical protein
MTLAALRLCVFALFSSVAAADETHTLRELLDAIRTVESGGRADLVGDGGRSIGPYQIQRAYWSDAGVPCRYEQVRDARMAEAVMKAYWLRYARPQVVRAALGKASMRDLEILARIHNGGPAGTFKVATDPYWAKVRKAMCQGVSTPSGPATGHVARPGPARDGER